MSNLFLLLLHLTLSRRHYTTYRHDPTQTGSRGCPDVFIGNSASGSRESSEAKFTSEDIFRSRLHSSLAQQVPILHHGPEPGSSLTINKVIRLVVYQ